ncbi:hypothetical protein F2P81_007953 [Scophthalmus maximus]|uniref:Uncharacterized protein n=1 Tax=Scophthalmus maximus TaxID=52904 RepID=A0A6A4T600_SCOMX|nr:hypothetical protein F2P81_007953 [Scophthalmus maximus]
MDINKEAAILSHVSIAMRGNCVFSGYIPHFKVFTGQAVLFPSSKSTNGVRGVDRCTAHRDSRVSDVSTAALRARPRPQNNRHRKDMKVEGLRRAITAKKETKILIYIRS